jgi:hypothetical protein
MFDKICQIKLQNTNTTYYLLQMTMQFYFPSNRAKIKIAFIHITPKEETHMANVSLKKVTQSESPVEAQTIEVKIQSVTSPSTVQNIALEKGITEPEVYVRITFAYDGETYGASNKLKFLRQDGYQELLDAKQNQTPIKIDVTSNEWFYIHKPRVAVKDLFKPSTPAAQVKSIFDKLFTTK